MRLLQATQLAQHLVVRLQVALDTEPRVQRLQARLVARPPPLQEFLLVPIPLRAPHAQPGLLTRIRLRPLLRRPCLQAGLRCAEPPDLQLMPPGALPQRVRCALRGRPPLPLHRDPVQALLAQPSQVLRAHDAAVEDHRRALPGQRAQPPDRFLQRAGLADVARQHFRPPRKALPVQQQAERDQRAVMALLLGAAARRVGVLGPAGMEGVGEVVEDDAGLEAEQLALVGEEGRLDLVAGLPEGVGGEVERVGGEVGGPQAEQFGQGGVVLQPAQGLALAGRMQGAGEDLGAAEADVARAQSGLLQALAQAQLASEQVEQAGRAGLAHVGLAQAGGQQRERLLAGCRCGIVGDLEAEVAIAVAQAAADERGDGAGLGGDALGEFALGRIGVGQRTLAGQLVADGGGEAFPVGAGDAPIEVGGEMGEDDLANLGTAALGVDEAVGGAAGSAVGAGLDAPDEHSPMLAEKSKSVNLGSQHVVSTLSRIRQKTGKDAESKPARRCAGDC